MNRACVNAVLFSELRCWFEEPVRVESVEHLKIPNLIRNGCSHPRAVSLKTELAAGLGWLNKPEWIVS